MASSGVNVLRYSALIAGVSYGLYRQSTLNAQSHKAQVDREYQRQASLITQAKAEFKKKNMPPGSVTKGGEDRVSVGLRMVLMGTELTTHRKPRVEEIPEADVVGEQ
ncbi:MAG: hypothetical protein LQ341_007820 [Variospora aurantia]|nr:MAG: hypothetical protein LQ341_007820 [Variospora aurantia]